MKYLQREVKEFERTKAQFAGAYDRVLEGMAAINVERGRVRDIGSPLHHRKSPQALLGVAQGKCHRLERLLTQDKVDCCKVIEECSDIANYIVFIAAFYTMLAYETAEGGAE